MYSLRVSFEQAVKALREHSSRDSVVLILRHGQSLGQVNPSAYRQLGDAALPITRVGVQESIAAARIIEQAFLQAGIHEFDIVTSTGERSDTTADLIFEFIHDPKFTKGFREDSAFDKQKFGKFDGFFTDEERASHVPIDFALYSAEERPKGPFRARPPGGESLEDVKNRIAKALAPIISGRKPTAIVTHGTNALCIEDILMNRGEEWVLTSIDKRPNCSIHMLYGSKEKGFQHLVVADHPMQWKHMPDIFAPVI